MPVGCDRTSRTVIAHAVPLRGASVSWTAEHVCRDLIRLGHYGGVTLRSDQEPALVCVLQDVAALRVQHSAVGGSQANGPAERAVRTCEELLRGHTLAFATSIGEHLSLQHAVFLWLIGFATTVINQHLAGKDGRTAFEHMKHKLHRWCAKSCCEISGMVAGGEVGERLFLGIRLGSQVSSGEHLAARNYDGFVVRTRPSRSFP